MKKVRMTDVAKSLGVSQTTVSLALNNNSRISDSTKKKVWDACKKMGYCPDPAAKALVARKWEDEGESAYLGTLAVLESECCARRRQRNPQAKVWDQYLHAACESIGYRLDSFVVGETEREQSALNRVLLARGIHGLAIYGAGEELHTWALDWGAFAAVSYTSSPHEHFIHNVMSSSYQDAHDAIVRLREKGYERPGYFTNRADLDYWVAGFSSALETWGGGEKVPRMILTDPLKSSEGRGQFLSWFRQYSPDVLVTNYGEQPIQILADEGIRVPEDVGYFCLDVLATMTHLSGLIQKRNEVFQVMVDLLHGMLARNAFGPPPDSFCIQIPSVWNQGETLKAAGYSS